MRTTHTLYVDDNSKSCFATGTNSIYFFFPSFFRSYNFREHPVSNRERLQKYLLHMRTVITALVCRVYCVSWDKTVNGMPLQWKFMAPKA